ncbi:Phosphatase nudJ [Plesiomonas shigelloides]|uniref:nucleotide triphosphate diphosphatase NUDT15 n=1 Tax=Plesiomonas shigelloides TaxID=703 RepID=UPI000D9B425E|nr:NUDIX hydrolase [Plesiomonas shigelloides]SPZ44287.1 Phosphatase nudJ [Plesiomonas shigelloides]
MNRPYVGVGVILQRADGKILVGKRSSKHAPYWSIPGGHLEAGESFAECAIREVAEETGLVISNPQVIALTNNLETFQQEGKHTVSVCLLAHTEGEPQNLEPHKCEGWRWVEPTALPEPHFEASRLSIYCWLNKQMTADMATVRNAAQ